MGVPMGRRETTKHSENCDKARRSASVCGAWSGKAKSQAAPCYVEAGSLQANSVASLLSSRYTTSISGSLSDFAGRQAWVALANVTTSRQHQLSRIRTR
jgi:hypothetical protein